MRRWIVLALALLAPSFGWAQPDLLFQAATRGDRAQVLAALEQGADIDVRDTYGQTPLMYAISSGQAPEFVEMLVQQGADVNARTEAGWTPLMYAARDLEDLPFTRVVLLLYAAGADPRARSAEGKLARHYRDADPPPEPVEAQEAETPAEPSVGPFQAIASHLAGEAGFDLPCGTHDPSVAKQWCGHRGQAMEFETFREHWDAALHVAAPGDPPLEPRRAWTYVQGSHLAFYELPGGSLGVSFDPGAGLVLLTLR